MSKQIKLYHQIWAVIVLCIVLMAPAVCGRTILNESYEDTEPFYKQRVQQQRAYETLKAKNILLQRLQPPLRRLVRNNSPLLRPCYFKLCK